jgi:hypothetical protein
VGIQNSAAIAHRTPTSHEQCRQCVSRTLVTVIHRHGGDVIKFAGDAIIVIWEGDEARVGEMACCGAGVCWNCNKGWEHADGTKHIFRIHCGLCCGPLEPECIEARSTPTCTTPLPFGWWRKYGRLETWWIFPKRRRVCRITALTFDMGVYQHIDDCHPAALEPCFLTDIILEEDMIMYEAMTRPW